MNPEISLYHEGILRQNMLAWKHVMFIASGIYGGNRESEVHYDAPFRSESVCIQISKEQASFEDIRKAAPDDFTRFQSRHGYELLVNPEYFDGYTRGPEHVQLFIGGASDHPALEVLADIETTVNSNDKLVTTIAPILPTKEYPQLKLRSEFVPVRANAPAQMDIEGNPVQ